MFEKFDRALARALSGEQIAFGAGDRRLALATARRAAAENRVKALNEASLGHVAFAAIHEGASTRFHEDAEEIATGKPPLHHPLAFYMTTAESYRRIDIDRSAASPTLRLVPETTPAPRRSSAA